MNAFTIAATVLLASLAPLLLAGARWRPIDGLVALELAGAIAVLVLMCLAVGLHQSIFFTLSVIGAVTSWIGGLVIARFLGRWT